MLQNARENGRQFMFTRRKIFLPVNHPVNLYTYTRHPPESMAIHSRMSATRMYIAFTSLVLVGARFYLAFK